MYERAHVINSTHRYTRNARNARTDGRTGKIRNAAKGHRHNN